MLATLQTSVRVIAPYWSHGAWVFDDPDIGRVREPCVAGIPAMIDVLATGVPNARSGFRLTFSDEPFEGYQRRLEHVCAEYGGHHYRCAEDPAMEGWACPAIFHSFDAAPETLYARAEPLEVVHEE